MADKSIYPSHIAAARLLLATAKRSGKQAPEWVHELAAATPDRFDEPAVSPFDLKRFLEQGDLLEPNDTASARRDDVASADDGLTHAESITLTKYIELLRKRGRADLADSVIRTMKEQEGVAGSATSSTQVQQRS